MTGDLVGLLGLTVAPKTGGDREGEGELNQSAPGGLTASKTGGDRGRRRGGQGLEGTMVHWEGRHPTRVCHWNVYPRVPGLVYCWEEK